MRLHSGWLVRGLASAIALAACAAPAPAADQLLTSLITSYNTTGRRLAGELAKAPGNIVLSPASIGTVMAMTFSGARGETARQMASALAFNADREEIDHANRALLAILAGAEQPAGPDNAVPPSPPARLAIANALFVIKDGVIGNDYMAVVKERYSGEVFAAAKLDEINTWVRDRTEGKIDTILDRLSPNSLAVLLDAIYFKAVWAQPFHRELTAEAAFHLAPAQSVPVPMMRNAGRYAAVAGDGFKAIRIPYANPALDMIVMVLVVPDEIDGLAAVAQRLGAEQQAKLFVALADQPARPITLAMPRFKATYGADLVAAFKQMGMKLAFDLFKADFSGMTGKPRSEGAIAISQIVHKVVLEVAEEGTEAAAATAVEMLARSAVQPEPLRVDRPFLFFITDTTTGAVLFEGRIVDPR